MSGVAYRNRNRQDCVSEPRQSLQSSPTPSQLLTASVTGMKGSPDSGVGRSKCLKSVYFLDLTSFTLEGIFSWEEVYMPLPTLGEVYFSGFPLS